jgi:hypothetical protein
MLPNLCVPVSARAVSPEVSNTLGLVSFFSSPGHGSKLHSNRTECVWVAELISQRRNGINILDSSVSKMTEFGSPTQTTMHS